MASLAVKDSRRSAFDPLRVSRFWLYDVAPIDSLAVPIFTPLSGFTSVTAPEITIETQNIQEGNWPFPKKVVKGADVGSIVLTRGVTFPDSDFWKWTNAAIHGNTGSTIGGSRVLAGIGGVTYRRSLLLIHFFRNFGQGEPTGNVERTDASLAAAAVAGASISLAAGVLGTVGEGTGLRGTTTALSSAAQLAALQVWGSMQPHTLGIKVPARAFLLQGCIPTRYKTGGDFDANSGEVSIQELELAVELVEEITLAAS